MWIPYDKGRTGGRGGSLQSTANLNRTLKVEGFGVRETECPHRGRCAGPIRIGDLNNAIQRACSTSRYLGAFDEEATWPRPVASPRESNFLSPAKPDT